MKSAAVLCLLAAACSALPTRRERPLGRRLGGRVLAGQPVDISEYPWMVSMEFLNEHLCGGSIISPTYVLTAAHCVFGADANYVSVRAGTSTRETGGTLYNAAAVLWHSSFNVITGEYDIGFVAFYDEIEYQAVSLATSELEAGSSATVLGWGDTAAGKRYSEQLTAVGALIVSREQCREQLGADVTGNVVCAGDAQGADVACAGDDGGPLVVGATLYGVASWGRGCGQPGRPGAYTNVAALHDWISVATGVD